MTPRTKYSFFEEWKLLRGRTNGFWIGELLEIFVAETVEAALRKIADVQHIGKVGGNKVSPLGLSNYFPKVGDKWS